MGSNQSLLEASIRFLNETQQYAGNKHIDLLREEYDLLMQEILFGETDEKETQE